MELKDFIKGTLTEIIEAVTEVQAAVKPSGAMINPREYGRDVRTTTNDGASIYQIDFDIAVTVSDTSGAKGGIGVFVAGIGLGTKGETAESNVSQNRIKFQIPISYPMADEPRKQY